MQPHVFDLLHAGGRPLAIKMCATQHDDPTFMLPRHLKFGLPMADPGRPDAARHAGVRLATSLCSSSTRMLFASPLQHLSSNSLAHRPM